MYLLATANGSQVSLQNADSKHVLSSIFLSSTSYGCASSPDSSLLAVAHSGVPYITVYNTSDWSKVADPAQLPPNGGKGCAFSPDGSLLAVAHNSSPYITVYNTSDWTKRANPAQLPPSTGNGCAFSPDGSLLAVAHSNSPCITIYNTSDWTKLANPAQLPVGSGNGCAFSPDGSLLAVAHSNSPYITVYNTSDWTKLANPAQLPAVTGYGCAFSPDGSLLAVAHNNSPFTTVYNTSTWGTESGFSLPSSTARAVSFHTTPAHRIRGTVRDKDGDPVSRTVRAHRRSDGVLVAQTVSDAITGEYELLVYPDSPADAYDVQFLADPGESLNDLIYARTTAEAVS